VLIHAGRLTARAVIEGADHLPNMRRPEAFDRMVLEFLSQPEH
jgi:hypothetical protein